MKTIRYLTLAALTLTASARADVRLPAVFSEHMVVQAGKPVPVWGWADANEAVTVSLAGQSKQTTADDEGAWKLALNPLAATAEPQTLSVQGKNKLTVGDVLVGEVWLASGQSNMAFQVLRGLNPEQEAAAAKYPQIRMFTVARKPIRTPQSDCAGSWQVCSPETVGTFSAVAYFFGRELHQQLKTPVGLINSSVGGTDIAAWTSEPTQRKDPDLAAAFDNMILADEKFDPAAAQKELEARLKAWPAQVKKWKEQVAAGKAPANSRQPPKPTLTVQPREDNNFPANLYNGMIAPLVPYATSGVIWYQGEHNTSNALKAKRYYRQLPLLVSDWREQWQAELPFAWVQLPQLARSDARPLVREAMLQALVTPNTGMAVTIDVGMPDDNHPKNKQEVGRRLALWALGTVYKQPVASTSGPLPAGHVTSGREVALKFKHADGGLVAKDGTLKGFEIAGDDKQFKPAVAKIVGSEVVVSHPDVAKPVAVRYAFTNNPDCNLYNGAGLPASPFRTDDWE